MIEHEIKKNGKIYENIFIKLRFFSYFLFVFQIVFVISFFQRIHTDCNTIPITYTSSIVSMCIGECCCLSRKS